MEKNNITIGDYYISKCPFTDVILFEGTITNIIDTNYGVFLTLNESLRKVLYEKDIDVVIPKELYNSKIGKLIYN